MNNRLMSTLQRYENKQLRCFKRRKWQGDYNIEEARKVSWRRQNLKPGLKDGKDFDNQREMRGILGTGNDVK